MTAASQTAPRNRVAAPAPASPNPDRIAFLGAADGESGAGEPIVVQALCWPTVPEAWIGLNQAWRTLRIGRGNPSPYTPVAAGTSSWIRQCAPQLAEPFQGTAAAEESSVAALLARTPVQIAVSIHGLGRSSGATSPRTLSNCLVAYDRYLRGPLRRACTMLVCRSQSAETDRLYLKDLDQCRAQMAGATWLRDMQLQAWTDPVEPLPLELAQLAAASVMRHVLADGDRDPVFDAVSTKLTNDPFPRGWVAKTGRSSSRKRG